MSDQDLIVQQASAPAARLILLFHGVGSRPEDLVPLGRLLAEADHCACTVQTMHHIVTKPGNNGITL